MKKPKRKSKKATPRNLTFPDNIWEIAQQRAEAHNRSVSNYLQTLVLRDCGAMESHHSTKTAA